MGFLFLLDPLQLPTAPSFLSLSLQGGFLYDPPHFPGLATLAGHLVFNNPVPVNSPPLSSSPLDKLPTKKKNKTSRADGRDEDRADLFRHSQEERGRSRLERSSRQPEEEEDTGSEVGREERHEKKIKAEGGEDEGKEKEGGG